MMTDFIDIIMFAFSIVFPLVAILTLGYFLRASDFLDDKYISITNKLCFRVLLPTLIFYSIYSGGLSLNEEVNIISFSVISVTIFIISLIILVPIFIKDNMKRGIMIQGMFRSNFLFFGIPIINSVYGIQGAASAALLNAFIIPVFNISAVTCLEMFNTSEDKSIDWRKIIKNIIKNPLIIAAILALLSIRFNVELPSFVEKTIMDLSKTVIPIAILSLGASFQFSKVKNNGFYIAVALLVKLVISPVIITIIAILLGYKGMQLFIISMLYASPIAIMSYVMAYDLGGDHELAGQLIVFSTIVACFTVFMQIIIFRLFDLL